MTFWLICLAAGISITAGMLFLLRPVTVCDRLEQDLRDAGTEEALLRWCRPWVRALTPMCRRLMSRQLHWRLSRRLEMAGWQDRYDPEEFLAMQCLAGMLGAGATVATMSASLPLSLVWLLALPAAGAAAFLPFRHLQVLAQGRQARMLKEFPFILDITTLCVEAGANFHGALVQVAAYCPDGALKQELARTLAQIRAGMPRHQALDDMASRTGLPAVKHWVIAVRQAEQMGMSLAPLLRAQAARQRSERFLRAETKAMQAPVKMLFPLVSCIFPCTFLVIAFPVAVQLLEDLR
ncbi:type II secretion system F family protein [Paracandidimonas soli]|uniref:Tight adherence protein C n=1 Tax=Paracandidimonas soli TaxID=1917182 RepID=A0A4R3VDW0_9BURK|nr:type II secretion system F family protein [Paracandidimonas soli]TCV01864.1 tight adherence protein C [Paracandidimonas soli]